MGKKLHMGKKKNAREREKEIQKKRSNGKTSLSTQCEGGREGPSVKSVFTIREMFYIYIYGAILESRDRGYFRRDGGAIRIACSMLEHCVNCPFVLSDGKDLFY